jgi:hypothetical protein
MVILNTQLCVYVHNISKIVLASVRRHKGVTTIAALILNLGY